MKSDETREFQSTFRHKVIYIFTVNDEAHKGLIKIGDATLKTDLSVDCLPPDCRELNQAAFTRIKTYTNTAGITPILLHTELAVKTQKAKDGTMQLVAFRDHEIHRVLENSGIRAVRIDKSTGREWFKIEKETAIEAIDAVKKDVDNLSNSHTNKVTPVIFRPEQKEAIARTVTHFRNTARMLWNAKMRFGKTLCALQVVKECNFQKTIILTHRPVVNDGWYEDFTKIFHDKDYLYGSKSNGNSLDFLIKDRKKFVYFASIQDLRGSEAVGGKFEKNSSVFNTEWDCVIVDEAHEGTQTALGDETIRAIVKEETGKTKFLALSGTPFNIMEDYDDTSIYTWDYIMEQESKSEWDKLNFGDSNPYEDLPELRIYTYNLGDILYGSNYITYEDKAFNFHEFFRVWTGDYSNDYAQMPSSAKIGDFVHEKDIISFFNLMTKEDEISNYPYSKKEYRELFRHSLWMVPGVKEARALKVLMLRHHLFGNGQFDIVNVAGNDDEESSDALNSVRNAISAAEKGGRYTITLSCGKLTTGVTVKEWTAVFMLSGSSSTSAANYLQTIFRVQSPCNKNGKIKECAYVFDFAPDRTLKMVAEAVSVSSKAGKSNDSDKKVLGKFLNYCPVIAISGSQMTEYKADKLLQELKKAYAEKVVRSGFDDTRLYNDELFKLQNIDIEKFNKLKAIIGATRASKPVDELVLNDQGFADEKYESNVNSKPKSKSFMTEEDIARLDEIKKRNKQRNVAISILRGISIRMPLLIYGAEIPYDEEITLDRFVEKVDASSWKEFMPAGVTKKMFSAFRKYYDEDIFIAAGRKIRNIAREADTLLPLERVKKIAGLFSYFKNPDKETVLTPWRVVNIHLSITLGGYDFFDDEHEKTLEAPRFVDHGSVTAQTFGNEKARILEVNSKTGLYPLYVTYSLYRTKCDKYPEKELSPERHREIWTETLQNNTFVICKTPMAKQITQRTLAGYSDTKINAHYFEDIINQIIQKKYQFESNVLRNNFWKKGSEGKMKFDAVVGNPPYQEETIHRVSKTNGQAPRKSIFQYFQIVSDDISSRAVSLIYPGARWIHRSGKGMEHFGLEQINDKTLEQIDFYPDSRDIFDSTVAIADGISIVYKNKLKTEGGFNYVYHKNGSCIALKMENPGSELIPLNPKDGIISNKVKLFIEKHTLSYLHHRILPRNLFGIESNFVEENPEMVRLYSKDSVLAEDEIKLFTNDKAGKAGRSTWYIINKNVIPANPDKICEYQVVVSSANAGGQKRDNQLAIIDNNSAFGRSRVALASFKTYEEASNFYKYASSYIIKYMFLMTDEALTSLGKKVPDILDYSFNNKLIDFAQDIDRQFNVLLYLSSEEIDYIKDTVKNKRN